MFRQSLAEGHAEVFFPLAEAFRTQDEPAYCGLGTLVMSLNALEVDPGALWKGSWRWYEESMLGCCVALEEIKQNGIAWDEWLCVVRCQGVGVDAHRADESSEEAFRAAVKHVAASSSSVLCVAYSRAEFGQTGTGHYSPIGAYVSETDHVLIMDVARFKHPPHWVPLARLWKAMLRVDETTGRSRGYATIERKSPQSRPDSLIILTFGRGRVNAARAFFTSEVGELVKSATTAEEELFVAARGLPPAVASLVSIQTPEAPWPRQDEERTYLEDVQNQLMKTRTHIALSEADAAFRKRDGPLPTSVSSCAALFLACATAIVSEGELRAALPRAAPLILGEDLQDALAGDVSAARAALVDMADSVERACALEHEAASCCHVDKVMHHP